MRPLTISLNLPLHPNPTHNQQTHKHKRPRRNRHSPILHRPPPKLHPHAPTSKRLRNRMHIRRIRQQNPHAQKPPDAIIVHQPKHNGFRESKMQPAAEQLGVDEIRHRLVKACLVMVPVYTLGAKKSISTPPKAHTGSTLRSRKRYRAGIVAEAVGLRCGAIAMTMGTFVNVCFVDRIILGEESSLSDRCPPRCVCKSACQLVDAPPPSGTGRQVEKAG
jgi:hypothetical protein